MYSPRLQLCLATSQDRVKAFGRDYQKRTKSSVLKRTSERKTARHFGIRVSSCLVYGLPLILISAWLALLALKP